MDNVDDSKHAYLHPSEWENRKLDEIETKFKFEKKNNPRSRGRITASVAKWSNALVSGTSPSGSWVQIPPLAFLPLLMTKSKC